jgi:hypothetical protein
MQPCVELADGAAAQQLPQLLACWPRSMAMTQWGARPRCTAWCNWYW